MRDFLLVLAAGLITNAVQTVISQLLDRRNNLLLVEQNAIMQEQNETLALILSALTPVKG